MADDAENEFRPGDVQLAGDTLTVYRGLVRLERPWVHVEDAKQGKSHYLGLGLAPDRKPARVCR
jgi:hypothetical protein